MSTRTDSRLSRDAFVALFRVLSERLELTPNEENLLMLFLRSIVFSDELAQHEEDGH